MDVNLIESNKITPIQLEDWQHLFDSVPNTRFYHHPHWYQCIAEHLATCNLQLGFLYADQQLQMVLPLCHTENDRHRVHPAHDHLSLNDVLIHPTLTNNANAMFEAIDLTLNKLGTGWWDWRVTNVPNHSALMQTLTSQALTMGKLKTPLISLQTNGNSSSANWLLRQTRESASFNCTGDVRAPHGKLRRNLKRLRKQLQQHGEIRIDNVVEADQLTQAFDQFLAVEASGWKGTGNEAPAISANQQLTAFYRSLLTPSIPGIKPEINLLWCNETCIAAQYGMRTGECLSLLKIGYNEEYARFSPGSLLLESILNDAPERNIDTLSLVTSPAWADRWHPDTTSVWQLYHYNSSLFGLALHKFDQVKQVAKHQFKSRMLSS